LAVGKLWNMCHKYVGVSTIHYKEAKYHISQFELQCLNKKGNICLGVACGSQLFRVRLFSEGAR